MEDKYKKIIEQVVSESDGFQESDYLSIYDLSNIDFEGQLKLSLFSFLIKFKQKEFISEAEFARILQTDPSDVALIFNYSINDLDTNKLFKFLNGLSVRDKAVKNFCNSIFKEISHYSFRG